MGKLRPRRVETQSCVFPFFFALGLAHWTQPDCVPFLQVSIVLYQLQILLLPGTVLSQDRGEWPILDGLTS